MFLKILSATLLSKASAKDPSVNLFFFRVVSHAHDTSKPYGHSPKEDHLCQTSPQFPILCVKPHDCSKKPEPTDCANLNITLTATKGENCEPSSRISHHPVARQTIEAPNCENFRNLPMILVDCSTKETSVDECSNKPRPSSSTNCESLAQNGVCTLVAFQPSENSIPCHQSDLETRVDECEAYMASLLQDKHRGYRESTGEQQECETDCGKIARKKIEKASVYHSPPDCVAGCSGAQFRRPIDQVGVPKVKRRNGLDPQASLNQLKPIRKRVCPPRCCPPRKEPKSGFPSIEQDHRLPDLKSCNYKRTDDCTKPKTSLKILCECEQPSPRQIAEFLKTYVPRIKSRELVTRYRDYFSPSLIERYEIGRSKRNGLQDEYSLPIPRGVIEQKRKELFCQLSDLYKSDAGESDQRICACNDHKPTKPHVDFDLPNEHVHGVKELPASICA